MNTLVFHYNQAYEHPPSYRWAPDGLAVAVATFFCQNFCHSMVKVGEVCRRLEGLEK